MDKLASFSVTVKPEPDCRSLQALAGRWNVGVDVRLSNPAYFVRGAVTTVFYGVVNPEPAENVDAAPAPVECQ